MTSSKGGVSSFAACKIGGRRKKILGTVTPEIAAKAEEEETIKIGAQGDL